MVRTGESWAAAAERVAADAPSAPVADDLSGEVKRFVVDPDQRIVLRAMTRGDLPILSGWLRRDHVRRWWGDDGGADDDETTTYLVVDEPAALVWAANFGGLEWHAWTSTTAHPHSPSYAMVDLDPGTSTRWEDLLTMARLHRDAFAHLKVRAYPKLTGRRGIQVWVPIAEGPSFDETVTQPDEGSRVNPVTWPPVSTSMTLSFFRKGIDRGTDVRSWSAKPPTTASVTGRWRRRVRKAESSRAQGRRKVVPSWGPRQGWRWIRLSWSAISSRRQCSPLAISSGRSVSW